MQSSRSYEICGIGRGNPCRLECRKNQRQIKCLIILIASLHIAGAIIVLAFPWASVHLFDWDEINFAECAREMIAAKQYFLVTINYLPFWEKPPLFIWMQALSMKVFGVSDYAARLPNAFAVLQLCCCFTMLAKYEKTSALDCYGYWFI